MNSIDIISRLNPVTYTWNLLGQQHGGKANTTEYGFLAQDIESILPSAVSIGADGYKSLNYIDFIPHLVGSVKSIILTDSIFSNSLSTLSNSRASITSQIDIITNTITTIRSEQALTATRLQALADAQVAQTLALNQLRSTVADLQATQAQQSTNSGTTTIINQTPVVNNYYTIIQTGSTNTGENSTGTTVINNNYYTTGSLDYSGSLVWTHS